jgi:hypothetical protein
MYRHSLVKSIVPALLFGLLSICIVEHANVRKVSRILKPELSKQPKRL